MLRVVDVMMGKRGLSSDGSSIWTARSVRALQLHSHKPHRPPPPQHHNPIHTFHQFKSCAVACGDNLRSGQVQQRENRKVAYLLSSDATSASTHPSTATTDAPTTAKAEPCPESLVRSRRHFHTQTQRERPPSAPTNPLHSALFHPRRQKEVPDLRPDLARLVLRCECGHQICERVWDERRQRQMKQLHQSVQLHQRQMNKPAECLEKHPKLNPNNRSSSFRKNNIRLEQPVTIQSTSSAAARGLRKLARKGGCGEWGDRAVSFEEHRVGVQQFRQLRLFVSVQRQHKVKQLQRTHRTQAFLHNPLPPTPKEAAKHEATRLARSTKRNCSVPSAVQTRTAESSSATAFPRTSPEPHAQHLAVAQMASECRAGNTSDGMFGEKKEQRRTETAEPARQTATPRSAVEKGQQTKRQQQRQSKVPKFLFSVPSTDGPRRAARTASNAVSRDAQRRQLFDNCSGNMRASENNGEGT
ncbi:hypothetical protein BLNAU_23504 [Blattamonas nauphoetae]|uniref:Uncharacterized protein n=1 Tax=Blattamonas nauphoetae TaxID=2049346 RepID=A0ABQ9WU60_9EUKA|nr:hypothetical protein BLNAU_23504 [Blattamonas nauphoetae]